MPRRLTSTARRRNPLKILAVIAVVLVAAAAIFWAARDKYYEMAYPMKYTEIIDQYAEKNNLPKALVYAVVRCESGFRPDVVSSIGARGMMQLTEDTFDWVKYRMGDERDITYDDMFDPERNVEYGTFLLRTLLDEYETIDNALCGYHAGWGSVRQWLNNPKYSSDGKNIDHIPFGDTSQYVKKVNKTMEKYKELYDL
ncbi:lytic transglycosylase domain-containing protein [Zongyangia hominis]|uniref:Lytic transglycosylase domain-containing protein n=1 Tax=Zongyangia hominis TaxID=2763677 RepID=A0A926EEA9_9FIRM|nr:lytic transglycosylase domain-containing protein [Zongyangia hominis]MBC8570162.1 lytic transglycosylase domain-containing protein [Zongyangia hominis]